MTDTVFHPLTAGFGLALPADAKVQAQAHGIAAELPGPGWRLTAYHRRVPAASNARQLHAAVAATLAKRTPALQPASMVLDTRNRGWSGLASRLSSPEGRTVQLLSLLVPDTAANAIQVVLVLDARHGAIPPGLPLAWLQANPQVQSLIQAAAQQEIATRASYAAREPGSANSATLPVGAATHAASAPPSGAANPYAAPVSPPSDVDADADHGALLDAGKGQRILVWCVLLGFLTRGLHRHPDVPMLLSWAIAVALLAFAFRGVLLIADVFDYGRGQKLGLLFASTLPLIGIGIWVWLSVKTTRALRAAGYRVGLFGVKS